ncbi:GNAT family N-acetyltransferase [Nocardioides marinquilinus]|uniref:GNAT family N-acetyltransferase n=1 Tax=Nocardioides marinquilinus TaxID=1210400 RepID=UPI0031F0EE72
MSEVLIRPMRADDVAAAERLSSEVFLELDRRAHPRDWPEPRARSASHAERWTARTRHLVATDPAGCWAADGPDGALVGFATSLRRDGTWCLATYVVRGDQQGSGLGRRLLDAALEHSRGCLRGMLSSSTDPGAVRRYLVAGFTMHPQMLLRGPVDRGAIPPGTGEKVREGTPADTDLLESVDRARRGSGHGPDHAFLQARCRLLVSDTTTGTGYAYVDDGQVVLLAAQNRRTAARVLWTAVADGPEEQTIGHVTAANAWAIDVGTACRLTLHTSGYLALRGMDPPAPYLHHGSLL